MNEVSLKPVIDELETLFSKFNKAFFEGKLEKPVITVSPDHTRGAYGWCTGWKAWQDGTKEGGYYEINLCAEYLNRPFEETCGTLLHEMVHLQNLQDNVQDTSRSGSYVIRDYAEFQGIMGSEQPEIEKAWNTTDDLLDNQFIPTAGNMGLSRWEKILGITPKGTDSLEDRRFRILTRINEELPYTLPQLRNILETLCGKGNYSADVEEGTYQLLVKIGLAAKNNFNDVESLLNRVVPQNMVVTLLQLYNTHAELGRFTHAQLAAYTHNQLRNEVLKNGE